LVTAGLGHVGGSASRLITRQAQKPPWQRPIPARVRNLTPSMVRAPRSMAASTSPSVTSSQRHAMRPKRGSPRATRASSSKSSSAKRIGASMVGTKSSSGSSASPCLGEQRDHVLGDRRRGGQPGRLDADHVHEARHVRRPMTKSSPSATARSPANSAMQSRLGDAGREPARAGEHLGGAGGRGVEVGRRRRRRRSSAPSGPPSACRRTWG
jgi:hypothetical protein